MKSRAVREQDYADGFRDGSAGKEPAFERLALGANYLNDYEKGYVDSGRHDGTRTSGGELPTGRGD